MPTTPPYHKRLLDLNRALDRAGWSRAEAARRIGKSTQGGIVYVQRVLRGGSVSTPVVSELERVLSLDGEAETAGAS